MFAGHAIYDRTGSPERVRRIVEALQAQTGVGALFTAPASPGDLRGSVPGTLSFDAARWGHPRAGAILISPDWSDDKNELGWPGTSRFHRCRRPRLERPLGHSRHADRRRSRPANERRIAVAQRQRRPRAHSVSPGRDRGAGVDARPRPRRGARRRGATTPDGEPTSSVVRVENQVGAIRYSLSGHFSEVAGSRYLDYTVVERAAVR